MLSTGALIASGLIAAGGAGLSAYKRGQGLDATNSYYDYAEDVARSNMYGSLFNTTGGKALLKLTNKNYKDTQEAINNQMLAGGATVENTLAARQANNENRDKVNMQILQADDQNRRSWEKQLIGLKGQRANAIASAYNQAASDWSQWGAAGAQALLSYGSSGLLGGLGDVAADTETA